MSKINLSDKEEFFYKSLMILSILSNRELTMMEARTLSKFMVLASNSQQYVFSAPLKIKVAQSFIPRTAKQTLSQRISSLIRKGYLYRDEDNLVDFIPSIKYIIKNLELNVNVIHRPVDNKNGTPVRLT